MSARNWSDGIAPGLVRVHRLAKSRAGHKAVLRQWVEMIGLSLLRGNGPNFYQMSGFWRRDCRWSAMTGHLSYRQFNARIGALNPSPYLKLSQNKIAEKAILTLMGVPTPRFLGLLAREWGCDTSGSPLRDAKDLVRMVSGDAVHRLCFKLLEGHGGRGFLAVDVLRGGPEPRFRTLQPAGSGPNTSDACSASELVAGFGDEPRILEEYLDQHPAYAAFNATSVNTLRIWVLRRAGKTSTRLAFLRIGRAGSLVDNTAAGGILASIDLQTGRLSEALDNKATRLRFSAHPDHGAPIEGVTLPMFREARALAERCLTVFPHLNFAGMDVAMTPTGPVIIESNVQPSRNGAASIGVSTSDVFDPEFVTPETIPQPPPETPPTRPRES